MFYVAGCFVMGYFLQKQFVPIQPAISPRLLPEILCPETTLTVNSQPDRIKVVLRYP